MSYDKDPAQVLQKMREADDWYRFRALNKAAAMKRDRQKRLLADELIPQFLKTHPMSTANDISEATGGRCGILDISPGFIKVIRGKNGEPTRYLLK